MFKEESRYNIYTDLGKLIASNVSFDEALSWLAKGLTSDFHFAYNAKEVKDNELHN